MWDEGKKAYFWKACKLFSMLHWQLMCNNTRLVVSSIERQHAIISDVHKGLGRSKARPMSSHCKRDSKIQRFQIDFSGAVSSAMLKNLLRNATNVKSRGKLKKVSREFHGIPEVKAIDWYR